MKSEVYVKIIFRIIFLAFKMADMLCVWSQFTETIYKSGGNYDSCPNGVKMASSIALQSTDLEFAPDAPEPATQGLGSSLWGRVRKVGQNLRNISREDAKTIALGIGAGIVTKWGLTAVSKIGVAAAVGASSTTIAGAALAAAIPIAAAMAVGATASLATSAVKHARAGKSFRSFWERDNLKKAGVSALIAGGTLGYADMFQHVMGETATQALSTAFHKMTDGLSAKLFHALPLGSEAHASVPATNLVATSATPPNAPASAPLAAAQDVPATVKLQPVPSAAVSVAQAPDTKIIPVSVTDAAPADATPAPAPEQTIRPLSITEAEPDGAPVSAEAPSEVKIKPVSISEETPAAPAEATPAPKAAEIVDKGENLTYAGPHKTLDNSIRERALAWAKKMNPVSAFKATADSPAAVATQPVALPKAVVPTSAASTDIVADTLAKAKSVVTQDELTNHFTLERLQHMAKATTGMDAPADATAESLAKQLNPTDPDAFLKDIQQQAPQLKAENVAVVCTTDIPKERSTVNVIKTLCQKFKDHMGASDIALVDSVNEPNPQKGLRLLYQKAASAMGLTSAPQKTNEFIMDNISGANGVVREMVEAQPAL